MSDRFKEKRRGRRWVLIGLILVAIVLGLFAGYRLWLYARVQSQLSRIQENDEPITLEGINAWYDRSNIRTNAASLYLEAFKRIRKPKPNDPVPLLTSRPLPSQSEPFPDKMAKATRRYLEGHASALMLLRQARHAGRCRYPIDFTETDLDVRHLSDAKKAVHLLRLKAAYDGSVGNHEQAFKSVRDAMAVAASLAEQPLFISQSTSDSCLTLTHRAVQRLLSEYRYDQERLRILISDMERYSSTQAMLRAAVAERARHVAILESPSRFAPEGENADGIRLANACRRFTGGLSRAKLWYLGEMERYRKALALPLADRVDRIRSMREELGRVETNPFGWVPKPFKEPVKELFAGGERLPNVRRMVRSAFKVSLRDSRVRTLHRLTKVALAIECFRRENGERLPIRLTALVPEYLDSVPLDPFSGESLHYIRQRNGFAVYSVGKDRRDDGGGLDDGGSLHPDISFAVSWRRSSKAGDQGR